MTNREAIYKLIQFRRILERGVFPLGYSFDAEPFDMAISALEKQAIDKYCETCKHKGCSALQHPCNNCYREVSPYEDCWEPYTEDEA